MDKKTIINRLKEHMNFAIDSGYKKENILGIFLYGSQNYGFADNNSDIDSIIIFLPSFEDFCLKSIVISEELKYEGNENINIKDIRLIREMFMKQNINFLEILYTEYFILNPKYEFLFNKYFIDSREDISHYDINKTLKSICGQAIHTLNKNPIDKKNIYNAKRLYYFLKQYIENKSYIDCIKPSGLIFNELWDIKFGKEEIIKYNIDDLEKKLRKFTNIKLNQDIQQQKKALYALNTGVIEILKFSFSDNEEIISKKDFFKQLTHAEERAYYSIIQEIGLEGNISISKLVAKNAISRPVYNNLIIKLKENKMAEIINMGVKGTYIKIINSELKSEIL